MSCDFSGRNDSLRDNQSHNLLSSQAQPRDPAHCPAVTLSAAEGSPRLTLLQDFAAQIIKNPGDPSTTQAPLNRLVEMDD